MTQATTVKRIARLGTRARLIARECVALAPLREPRHRAALAAAMLIALACAAHWIAR
jgi:hypothetical protein